jgi:hypothetical protein
MIKFKYRNSTVDSYYVYEPDIPCFMHHTRRGYAWRAGGWEGSPVWNELFCQLSDEVADWLPYN